MAKFVNSACCWGIRGWHPLRSSEGLASSLLRCLVISDHLGVFCWENLATLVHRTDISRSIINRERWQIKNRKISEKQNIKKKGYVKARGRTRVNIGAAFQRWRELKKREGLESDTEVVLFLFDRWVAFDFALFHTIYPCWLLLEYAFVSSSLVSAIVVAMVVYVCVDAEIF